MRKAGVEVDTPYPVLQSKGLSTLATITTSAGGPTIVATITPYSSHQVQGGVGGLRLRFTKKRLLRCPRFPVFAQLFLFASNRRGKKNAAAAGPGYVKLWIEAESDQLLRLELRWEERESADTIEWLFELLTTNTAYPTGL